VAAAAPRCWNAFHHLGCPLALLHWSAPRAREALLAPVPHDRTVAGRSRGCGGVHTLVCSCKQFDARHAPCGRTRQAPFPTERLSKTSRLPAGWKAAVQAQRTPHVQMRALATLAPAPKNLPGTLQKRRCAKASWPVGHHESSTLARASFLFSGLAPPESVRINRIRLFDYIQNRTHT